MSDWTSYLVLTLILWCLLIRVPCWDPLGTRTQAPFTPPLVVDHGQEGGCMPLIYGNHFILMLGTE